LPGSFAERRHVGVVHVSDVIHNEGDVQSASGSFATLSPQEYIEEGRERGWKGLSVSVPVTSITKSCVATCF
jgi:hypothetical protein